VGGDYFLHTCGELFRRNTNGMRAINGSPAFAPTPLALRLNIELQLDPLDEGPQ